MARALVVLYQRCTIAEIAPVAERLVRQDGTVRWWTPEGAVVTDTAGLRIAPSIGMAHDIGSASAGADAILIPGGDPESIIGDEGVAAALRSADQRGVTIAAICAGVLVLADAGITAGRRITHNYRQPLAPPEIEAFTERFWAEALVEPDLDRGVVIDDNLITALPSAASEFAEVVVDRLSRRGPRDLAGS